MGPFHGYVDLLLVVVLTLLAVGLAFVFGEQGGPFAVRIPLGFLFVFVLPGYALTAALFPQTGTGATHSSGSYSVSTLERLVLSVGLSLVVVPLISIGLAMLSISITLSSVIFSIGAFTLATTLVAAFRTYNTSPQERFSIVAGSAHYVRTANWNVVQLVFVVMLILSAAGLTAAIVGSGNGDSFSELALHTQDDDGELAPGEYPDSLSVNESASLHVEIGNHEHRSVEYTVVVLLEEVDSDGTVADRSELDRFSVSLDHTERTVVDHELEPAQTGESLRVSYLLYTDDPPDQPTISNADQSVHFFTDVSD